MTRTLRRIEAFASLEDAPQQELARARQEADAGDPSWQEWIAEYEQGAALLLKLEVSVVLEEDGREDRIRRTNRNLWVEGYAHPPKVERQVAELAPKDFESFAQDLRRRQWALGVTDLDEMYVSVTLADEVIERLGPERRHLGEGVDASIGLTSLGS